MKPERKAEKRCGLCRRGVEAEDVCGRLWVDDDCVAHKKCMATGRRRRRTSSSPAPQDVDVNMSSPHKQRKRNHSRSRSRSLSNDTRENRRTRSSKRKELHVSMSDSELGAVEEMVAHVCNAVECVLCFIKCNKTVLTEQHNTEVQAFANQLYRGVQKHIIWVPEVDGTPLTAQHMIYFMHDISQALREQNYSELERLVFGLSQQDIGAYESFHRLHESFGSGRLESIHNILHDVITDDLSEAEKGTGVEVDTICKVIQKPVFVLFLRVCDATDLSHRVRSCLCHRQQSNFRATANTAYTFYNARHLSLPLTLSPLSCVESGGVSLRGGVGNGAWVIETLDGFNNNAHRQLASFTRAMKPDSKAERRCGLCRRGVEAEDVCGRLWVDDDCVAHKKCMQYSSNLAQYERDAFGGFYPDEVLDEIDRGKQLVCGCKCDICKKAGDTSRTRLHGATGGCAVEKCKATFHYPCANDEHVSAITARLVNSETQEVHYVVFCSEAHQTQYYKQNPNKFNSSDETSDEDDRHVNEHSLSKASGGRRRLTSSSPVPQDDDVSGSSPHKQRKRKHSRSRSRSLDNNARKNRQARSSKRTQRHVSEKVSDEICDEQPTELGTVEKMVAHECVLCFIECNRTVLTEQHKSEVQAFANQLYRGMQKHIIWVPEVDGTPLTAQHMIYFMHDISQALREQNYSDLKRLVFDLSQHDIGTYESFHRLHASFGAGRLESMHKILHDVIRDDLSEAEKRTGVKMSTLIFLGPIDNTAETVAVYVEQWMPAVLDKFITSNNDVFIVLGINVSHGTCSLRDLTPSLQDNVHMKVYCFADPGDLPVTCVKGLGLI
ncbi:hypothetical protein LSAT2_014514 [Lamellibrachia satsuma]|nr:hypothetical protein LSAT2_014514 [Lamellibrachia satsuma]